MDIVGKTVGEVKDPLFRLQDYNLHEKQLSNSVLALFCISVREKIKCPGGFPWYMMLRSLAAV